MRAVVFSGTTEGRVFSKQLAALGAEVLVSVATPLGAEEQGERSGITVHCGRLTPEEMTALLQGADLCVDATHPYAVEATRNIRAAFHAQDSLLLGDHALVPVYGYSHAPQISDITGRFILRGQVNELHPCVPAVCQYEIVFHFACFFSCYEWSVGGVSTATHSKFLYVGDSRAACEPFLYAGHVVFGSDDCRMPVYLRKPRTFIVLHPSFEAVRSPCVRIGEHIVQNLSVFVITLEALISLPVADSVRITPTGRAAFGVSSFI